MKLDPLDVLFSRFIRLRDKECQRCGSMRSLQACHMHGRARRSVRWDEDNVCSLCAGCHRFLDSQAAEKVDFFKKRLGDNYDLLEGRMHQMGKVDKQALTLYYKEKLKEMKE